MTARPLLLQRRRAANREEGGRRRPREREQGAAAARARAGACRRGPTLPPPRFGRDAGVPIACARWEAGALPIHPPEVIHAPQARSN